MLAQTILDKYKHLIRELLIIYQNNVKLNIYITIAGPRRTDGPRCKDILHEMEDQLVLLAGGRDRRGGPVLSFPQNVKREKARIEDYQKLLEYFLTVPRWAQSLD